MADVNMTKTEAYNRIMEYVKVAQEAVNSNHGDKVIRFTDAGGERRVSTCDTDSIKGAFHWFRSGKNKHENNLTRNDFRDCLLAFCGKQKLSELSKDLQEALMPEKFEHTGKPLSAKRIMEVAFKGLVKEDVFKIAAGDKIARQDYGRIMLDPAYRKECAQRALDRVGGELDKLEEKLDKLLMKQPVDLVADKCRAAHIDKLCTLPGDMADSVQLLEKLGFPREFICAVNFADSTCMAGGMLCYTSQEETCFEKMDADLIALLIDKGYVKVEYEEKYGKMAFHFTNPLNGGLSPASDPYLLKLQRKDDGKEENLVNMAMPSLNWTHSGFDNFNFSQRILDVKKREIGLKYASEHLFPKGMVQSYISPLKLQEAVRKQLDNLGDSTKKVYLDRHNECIDEAINQLIGDADGAEERRTNLLNFAEACFKLLNGITGDLNSLGYENGDDKTELMKILQYGGEDLGVDPFGENSEEQAENALKKALEIHHAHQKAQSGAELNENEAKLDRAYQKADKNYEENVYEEISKAIIQARKAGMKAFPIGAMGCGVFANDPKVIGRLAARAFLDYGGDMIPMFNMYKKGSNIEILKALVEAFNVELVARGHEPILKVDDLMDDTRLKQVAEKLTLLQPSMLEIKEKMSPVIDWDVFTDVNNEIEEDQLVEICNKLRNNIGIVKNSGLTEKQKTLLIKENLSNLLNEIFLTRLDDLEKEEQQSKDIASYREHVETTIKEKLDEVVKRFVDEDDLKNGMTALSNMMVPCLNKLGVLSLKVKNEIKIQTTESELDKLLDFINELKK